MNVFKMLPSLYDLGMPDVIRGPLIGICLLVGVLWISLALIETFKSRDEVEHDLETDDTYLRTRKMLLAGYITAPCLYAIMFWCVTC